MVRWCKITMLSDEEKKAWNRLVMMKTFICYDSDDDYENNQALLDIEAIDTILNLIEKQSKEIEHQKEKRENQKQELAILNEKQKEFNKLVNTVNSYKGQFKKQQKEIEELKETLKCTQNSWYEDTKIVDKIKAKIEEIEQRREKDGECELALHGFQREAKIEILQSLLEKE